MKRRIAPCPFFVRSSFWKRCASASRPLAPRHGRKPGFYLWKVLLPLIVIVALSWSVFWVPDERFAQRSRITATGVLTVVAYQFGFGADRPRIGYLTLMLRLPGSFGVVS